MTRKFITVLALLIGVLALPYASKADSVTTTLTYADDTATTLFSAPGETITLTFNLPHHLNPVLTELNVPVSVDFLGSVTGQTAAVFVFPEQFFGGLFNLVFFNNGHMYDWSLFGPQIFDNNRNLTPGTFQVDTEQSEFLKDASFGGVGSFTSGTVVVSSATTVPEPTSLFMLGMGLFGLAPFARKRLAKK